MLKQLKQKVIKEIEQVKDLKSLEKIYRKYLGRQGELTKILRSLKDLSAKEKKEKGRLANRLRRDLERLIEAKSKKLSAGGGGNKEWIDVTAPGILPSEGHLHPISLVQQQVEEIFQSMGFSVVDGPEIENEYYNFDALNTPPEHPARELTDTFWLRLPADKKQGGALLRTHTSPMQARYMEKHNPPLRIIVPGRCFRHEATDASHDVQFYQVEGLMVGQDVSMANFKGIIEEFLKRFQNAKRKTGWKLWEPAWFILMFLKQLAILRANGRDLLLASVWTGWLCSNIRLMILDCFILVI